MSCVCARHDGPNGLYATTLRQAFLDSKLATTAATVVVVAALWWRRKRLSVGAKGVADSLSFAFLIVTTLVNFWSRRRRWHLQIGSHLAGSSAKQACPHGVDNWRGSCPCCKRPLFFNLENRWKAPVAQPAARGKCAYLICLWGSSPSFVMGAMVLGYAIKRTGSRHARVCMYTNDVPRAFITLLAEFWDCRLIEHVAPAMRSLSWSETEDRFEKVFTKLRGMALVEFEKVLMMDIDLLVRSNIDELFDLPAPAAMRRGMGQHLEHGSPLDGRFFFLGHDKSKWSWGQGTGINAGVMLWRPDMGTYKEMLSEISEPHHPEHMKGNGPEQDYLSRYWADAPWTHIGTGYNYQLHQMFFALHPDKQHNERASLLFNPDKIKIVHFSGENAEKPWLRVLDRRWSEFWPDRSRDAEYAKLFGDLFLGKRLWVNRDRESFDFEANRPVNWDFEGYYMNAENQLYRRDPNYPSGGGNDEFVEVPDVAHRATQFLETVLSEWFDTLQALEAELGYELRGRLEAAAGMAPEACIKQPGPAPSLRSLQQQSWDDYRRNSAAALGDTGSFKPWRSTAEKSSAALPVDNLDWHRLGGKSGWWIERDKCDPSPASMGEGHVVSLAKPMKVSVVCGATSMNRFVVFVEGGSETFQQEDSELAGVFAKVAGPHAGRHFSLPTDFVCEGDGTCCPPVLQRALEPIQLWASNVPPGSAVMLALVCVEPQALVFVLAALEPLGVPQVPPPSSHCMLAATGCCVSSGEDAIYSCHASVDVAYASSLVHNL